MFTLVYVRDGQARRHPLSTGDTVVGRAAVCDLAIDDPSISRRHARIRVHGDHCVITDLGGRNGTFVNGEHVSEAQLADGDTIVLGRFKLQLERSAPPAAFLSDQHTIVESAGPFVRRVDEEPETNAGTRPSANPERLLLLLSEISRQLVRWHSLPEILERIVSVVFETIAVERAFLLLLDERTGEPVPRVARDRSGTRLPNATLSRTVVRKVIDDRVALLATDAEMETGYTSARSLHDGHIRSFMCAPLWNQNAVIGVLYVDNPHSAELSVADLDILQALSSYAAVAIEQSKLSERILEETRQRELLQRYHSAAVVDRILASRTGADPGLVAEEREVSVLFADVVGFTTRAERMAPSAVAVLLNQCLGAMCEAVFAEEGTLDKFIGDSVLAIFGAPLRQPDHAARALRAAADMRRRMASLDIVPPVLLRIAVNSGVATVGDIGTPRRREYTVLGDVVNTCSRLVSAHCEPGEILVTAATAGRVDVASGLRPLGAVPLRGRNAPVEVFAYEPAGSQNE
jgi:adenylate cyclase